MSAATDSSPSRWNASMSSAASIALAIAAFLESWYFSQSRQDMNSAMSCRRPEPVAARSVPAFLILLGSFTCIVGFGQQQWKG